MSLQVHPTLDLVALKLCFLHCAQKWSLDCVPFLERCSIDKVLNDVLEGDDGADDAPEEAEDEDDRVLDGHPVEPAEVVPVGGRVDDGRSHDAQGRHLDSSQEGDEQV